jgi:hypothetical protein
MYLIKEERSQLNIVDRSFCLIVSFGCGAAAIENTITLFVVVDNLDLPGSSLGVLDNGLSPISELLWASFTTVFN